VAFAVDSDRSLLAEALALALHDEVHIRLEVDRADQRLDRCNPLPYQLREHPDVQSALGSVGVDLALDAASLTSRERWEPLTLIERAWGIDKLVLDAIAAAPERVGSIKARDVTLVVNGDYRAWGRLRAACLSDDEGEQRIITEPVMAAPAQAPVGHSISQTDADGSRTEAMSEEAATIGRSVDAPQETDESPPPDCVVGRDAEWVRLWTQGRTDVEIAGQYNVSRKRVANRICELRHEHGTKVVPHHRLPIYKADD
jgi:hypothetical protein